MNTWKRILVTLIAAGLAGEAAQAQWAIPADPAAKQEYVAKLVATAQQADAPLNERYAACRELAALGGSAAVPVLAALLSDEKLSHMARYGLEPNPDPAVDEALLAALDKLKGPLLTGVIDSIGIRRDAKAIPALGALLASPEADVVSAAAASLGRIGNVEAAAALEKALAGAPGAHVVALVDGCLRAADGILAAGQAEAAAGIYDRLRAGSAPKHLCLAALRGSILARGKAGISLILEQLRGADPAMTAVALRATYEVEDPELTQALAAELPKLPAERQTTVLQALGNRKDPWTAEAVTAAAKNGTPEVRVAAIRAACQIGSPACLPGLMTFAVDAEPQVAAAAQAGLAGFPGKEADEAVIKLIDAPDLKARLLAIDLVGQRRVISAVPVLIKTAESPDKPLAAASFRVLGDLGGPADVPAMTGLFLKSPSAAAENALAAVFARQSEPAGIDALCGALEQAAAPVKPALLRVLRAAGGAKALAAVRAAAADAHPEIQDAGVRVLCDWPGADAAGDQLNLAKSSPNPTYKALALRGYIRQIGGPDLAADQRQAMCKEAAVLVQRDAEKKLLLGALGNASDANSLATVTTFLTDPAAKEEALAAAIAIAERLVSQDPSAAAGAMGSVVKLTGNPDLLKRARRVLALSRPQPAAK